MKSEESNSLYIMILRSSFFTLHSSLSIGFFTLRSSLFTLLNLLPVSVVLRDRFLTL